MKEESSEEKLVEETDGEAGGSRVALVFCEQELYDEVPVWRKQGPLTVSRKEC